jgi:hypothetical protein
LLDTLFSDCAEALRRGIQNCDARPRIGGERSGGPGGG